MPNEIRPNAFNDECVFCPRDATDVVTIQHVDTKEIFELPLCDQCSHFFLLDHDTSTLN